MLTLKHISIGILFGLVLIVKNAQGQDDKSPPSNNHILHPKYIKVTPQEEKRKKRLKSKHREQAAVEEPQAQEAPQEQRPLTCMDKFFIVGIGVTLFFDLILQGVRIFYMGNQCDQCK